MSKWRQGTDITTGCPQGTKFCGYVRGEHYCSMWDTCQDLSEMASKIERARAELSATDNVDSPTPTDPSLIGPNIP